jgi:ribonuclease HI
VKVIVHVDGGARGNPGPAAGAAVLRSDDGELLSMDSELLGVTTNNVAEYRGLLLGLDLARQHGVQELAIRLDSELIVRQLTGEYRVKAPELKVLWAEAQRRLGRFSRWDVAHVPREANAEADRLVNRSIDRHTRS